MTDQGGYLASGSAGADKTAVERMVMNKAPLLASPGIVLPNSLYYDAYTCSVNACESTTYFARDKIAFNSTNLNGNTSCYIPSVLFTGNVYLVGTLPSDLIFDAATMKTTTPSNENAFFSMDKGWGFNCVQNVIYYLGSSSVSNVDISGETNFHLALAQCDTVEKRSEMIRLAGKPMCSYYVSSGPQPVSIQENEMAKIQDGAYVFRNIQQNAGKVVYSDQKPDPSLLQFVVPLRLPFSSTTALDRRLFFDTRLLTQPIQVSLIMRAPRFRANAELASAINASWLKYSSLTLQAFQFELSDKSLSLREELLAAPEFSTGLPFQYVQSMSFSVPSGSSNIASAQVAQWIKYTTNITSLMNADLTTILFHVQEAGDGPYANVVNSSSASGPRGCMLYGQQLHNIELKLNGQLLHRYDYDDYDSIKLGEVISPLSAYITAAAPNAPSILSDTDNLRQVVTRSYVYEISLSRMRALVSESHLQNTPRFTNQTFQLSFEIPPYQNNVNSNTDFTVTRAYTLYVTYCYNGCFLVGADGGQSQLITA